ncbi:MAG: hypothetical protein ACREMD_05130 [Gemmatimonadota bacterium]
MRRLLVAALLAAIVVTLWGAVSWAVLPWHRMVMETVPDGEAVTEALRERVPGSGLYHYPGAEGGADPDAWMERYRRGPNINLLVFSATGSDPFSPWLLGRGFVLNLVAAFLAAALLAAAAPALPGFGSRVLFIALLAGFAALQSRLVDWNWWRFPLDYSLVAAFHLVIGWTLAGLVLAWRLNPAGPGSR